MKNLRLIRSPYIAATVALFLPVSIFGHHGIVSNPTFYLAENLVEVEGEITGVFWRNPHPRLRLTVAGDNVEQTTWELEIQGSVASLRRGRGITADFVQVGDFVRAAGVVSRRNPRSMGLLHLLLPSGQEYVMDNRDTARWSEDRLVANGSEIDQANVEAAKAAATGIFRVWGRRLGLPPMPQDYDHLLTDLGRELAAEYDPVTDDLELVCRQGMPDAIFERTPIEFVDQGERIVIRIEEHDIERIINMGTVAPTENLEPTPIGYSVGRWDGETLEVTTNQIDWPFFDTNGTPQSNQVSYIERFSVSDDGTVLHQSLTAIDPLIFTAPIVIERTREWQPGEVIEPYNCAHEWNDATVE